MQNSKILVAMSGGVDSSVAAALLKKAGYDITGVFMINWRDDEGHQPGGKAPRATPGGCNWEKDQTDARKVAHKLGIKLYTWNFVKEYKKYVFDYFINAVKNGLTSNPDTLCNKYIKFGAFLDRARELGFETVATGHYAQINRTINQKNNKSKSTRQQDNKSINQKYKYGLFAGRDQTKDQSYFLYELNQEQLSQVMFPIGKYKKKKIRQLAKKFDLPVWNKKDSYGICYIGERNMPEFLGQFIKPNPGNIVDKKGKVLGKHQGLHNYTLGQRQGIGIGGIGPFFVVQKNYDNNNLIVTNDSEDPGLFTREIKVGEVNWIMDQENNKTRKQENKKTQPRGRARVLFADVYQGNQQAGQTISCLVRTRHLKDLEKCQVEILYNNSVKVIFDQPQKAITPGQAAVFYQAQGLFNKEYKVLGGGVILADS